MLQGFLYVYVLSCQWERGFVSSLESYFCENPVAPRPGLGRVRMGSTASFGPFALSGSVLRAETWWYPSPLCLMAHLITCGHLSGKEPVCLGGAEGFPRLALEPVTWLLGTQPNGSEDDGLHVLKKRLTWPTIIDMRYAFDLLPLLLFSFLLLKF